MISNAQHQSAHIAPDDLAPLFKPFHWVGEQRQRGPYDMLSDARDIAAGVSLALQMVERSQIALDCDEAPVVDKCDAGKLVRMAIAAMHFVEGRIDTYFEYLDDPERHPVTETERRGK